MEDGGCGFELSAASRRFPVLVGGGETCAGYEYLCRGRESNSSVTAIDGIDLASSGAPSLWEAVRDLGWRRDADTLRFSTDWSDADDLRSPPACSAVGMSAMTSTGNSKLEENVIAILLKSVRSKVNGQAPAQQTGQIISDPGAYSIDSGCQRLCPGCDEVSLSRRQM